MSGHETTPSGRVERAATAGAAWTSFLPVYDARFGPRLQHRARTFRAVFERLEAAGPRNDYRIVETGCLREPGNWGGDGQSTALFDAFVSHHGGRVQSVDLDPVAVRAARSVVGPRTDVRCADSLEFLWALEPGPIDLLYLDSFDVDWSNPHPSSLHHLSELCAALPKLLPGALIVVDDDCGGRGKGRYVRGFMESVGIAPFFDEYQVGWVLPAPVLRPGRRADA